MPSPLRPIQVDDLAFYIRNPRCMNLSDPGTGKTPPTCVYIEYLWKHKATHTIWTMPKSLLKKNKEEILRFTNLTESQVVIVDGTPKERKAQMETPAVIYLVGFKRFSDDWSTLCDLHPKINAVFVDEFHMGFSTNDSVRTQELYKCMKRCKYFLAMTGSLIAGRLTSAYPAIHIIEPRYYTSHYTFENFHAVRDVWTDKIIGWQNHDKLGRIFQTHAIRHTFEEVYGKEDPVIQPELVSMSKSQREAYDKFEKNAFLELDGHVVDGTSPGVAVMRARQIMCHPETFPGLMKPKELSGKDERLLVHLEDHVRTGKPLIIYGTFIPEQMRVVKLCESLGLTVSLINSTVTGKARDKAREDLEAGRTQVMVASPQTASVGFNWGHVDHIIFISIDYQDVNFSQAYKRAIRSKREIPLWVTILEYEKSIDQRMFSIVHGKSAEANKVDSTYKVLALGTPRGIEPAFPSVGNM